VLFALTPEEFFSTFNEWYWVEETVTETENGLSMVENYYKLIVQDESNATVYKANRTENGFEKTETVVQNMYVEMGRYSYVTFEFVPIEVKAVIKDSVLTLSFLINGETLSETYYEYGLNDGIYPIDNMYYNEKIFEINGLFVTDVMIDRKTEYWENQLATFFYKNGNTVKFVFELNYDFGTIGEEIVDESVDEEGWLKKFY
jgi:hypothetical protein